MSSLKGDQIEYYFKLLSMILTDLCKPSLALIKHVEITGILIGAQWKNQHSKYKIPLPSNYSDTVHLLNMNLHGVVKYLSQLKDADITNEMAAQIYSKIREDGYNYEKALEDGGVELHDIFKTVQHMISVIELRSATASCIPIGGTNLIIGITNDIASYALLDAAAHIRGDKKLRYNPIEPVFLFNRASVFEFFSSQIFN